MTPREGTTAVDHAALDRLLATTGGDAAFLAELIDTFLVDAPIQLQAMRTAAEAGAVADLVRPAHSLKTNSANMGAASLAEMCRASRSRPGGGSVDDAVARVAAAEAEFEAARGSLLALRPGS